MDQDQAELDRAVEMLRARLSAQGWTVTLRPRTGTAWPRINFEHELSGEMGLLINPSEDVAPQVEGFVRDSNAEFDAIGHRPPDMPHAALIGDLRERAHGWERRQIHVVAVMLLKHGVLSEAEARWMSEAGPAFQATR